MSMLLMSFVVVFVVAVVVDIDVAVVVDIDVAVVVLDVMLVLSSALPLQ